MTIPKSIFHTILFVIVLELIGFWVLLGNYFDIFQLILRSKFINSLPQLFLVLYFLYRINGRIGTSISRTDLRFYIFAILLGITAPFLQDILNIPYYQKITDDIFEFELGITDLFGLNSIASILIIPISEEFFFRHHIQKGFQEKFSPLVSILITSFLFGIIHITDLIYIAGSIEPNFHKAYVAFFLGIMTGILYYKSKSVGPPILLHIIWNLAIHASFT